MPAFTERSREISVASGLPLFSIGDRIESLQVLSRGVALIRTSSIEGNAAIVDVRGKGDILDDTALLPGERLSQLDQALALTDCTVLKMRIGVAEELRSSDPAFGDALIRQLSEQARRLSDAVIEAQWQTVKRRTTRRLAAVAETLERCGLAGQPLNTTQSDLAEFVGTTRPTLNAELGALAAEGAISMQRGVLTILDPSLLND